MSATDPNNGVPTEGTDGTGRAETGQPGARSPEPQQGPAPAPAAPAAPEAGPEAPADPERSAVPNRPQHPQGPSEEQARHDAPHGAPWGGPPQGEGGRPVDPRHAAPGQHAFDQHAAGGGGFGGPPPPPPPPPHGASMPGGSDPHPRPEREKRPLGRKGVLAIAGATALVTSLIVGPTAAIVTSEVLSNGGGTTTSSLSGENSGTVSSGSVSAVAEQALPSVVSIQTESGGGSGVVISSDGQILTNSHVVAGADGGLMVQFNDGSQAEATVLGADPVSDLAVIKAEGRSDLTPATFGDSDKVEVGANVVAIGSPLGLSGTVTAGVVSAVDRPVNTGATQQEQEQPEQGLPFGPPEEDPQAPEPTTSTVIDAIQTDAPINPGNSGGPLMNMNGEVIGINTAIASTGGVGGQAGSIGLGFAIPINQAEPIAEQLIADGNASYAAIEATITGTRDGGAEIVDVTEGGAADAAGLRAGDVVTKVGDRVVNDPNVLIAAIRSHQPDETVTVTYERDGETHETEVTLSAQSADSIGS